MSETDEPTNRGTAERLREAALWVRDSSLGIAGFSILVAVAVAGWTVSFIGLHTFAMQHMSLSYRAAWLVPVTFDGAPAGLTIVVMRAASHGRSGWVWRILIVFFTALSCWINYEHIHDRLGRCVAALMPLAAVIVFESLISEARKAFERRKGIEERPRLHPLRFVFDWTGSWAIVRCYVLDQPLPEALAASQRRAATRSTASPRKAAASPPVASPASPLPATASTPLAAPAATPGVPVPNPASQTPATPAQQPASPAATTPPTTQATSSTSPGTAPDAWDLDKVAEAFRALQAALGKSPSDQALADALGVSRSRAQQLRTKAMEAGHSDLAKPLRSA